MIIDPPPCDDLLATINLASTENNNYYQAIYGTQLYSTFFSVFAKFHVVKDENETEKSVEKIEFYLMNYKGDIELGLVEVKYENEEFKIYVKALEKQKGFVLDRKTNPIKFTKNNTTTFRRVLLKMSENGPYKNNVFDSEFYIKDGNTIIPKIRLDELDEDEINELYDNEIIQGILERQNNTMPDFKARWPGCRCVSGIAKIVF